LLFSKNTVKIVIIKFGENMEPIKGKKIPASLAIIAVYAMANAAAQAHETQKIEANKINDGSVDLSKQAPSIIDINSIALDLNQSATEQSQNKIDHAQVEAFSKDVVNKKSTREALQDVYGYLIQRYGQNDKSVLDSYLAEFNFPQISLADTNWNSGNNDSTSTNGVGIATPNGVQPSVNGNITVCHNACHCHCHGSRGWR
jgi:hypothetical protein